MKYKLMLVAIVVVLVGCQTTGQNKNVELVALRAGGHIAAVTYLNTVAADKVPAVAEKLASVADGLIAYLEGEDASEIAYGALTRELDGKLGTYGPVMVDLAELVTVAVIPEAPVDEETRVRIVAFLTGVKRGAETVK